VLGGSCADRHAVDDVLNKCLSRSENDVPPSAAKLELGRLRFGAMFVFRSEILPSTV